MGLELESDARGDVELLVVVVLVLDCPAEELVDDDCSSDARPVEVVVLLGVSVALVGEERPVELLVGRA